MAGDRKSYALRLDPALYNAIARLAATELRSVNGEIEFLLRDALKKRGIRIDPAPAPEDGAEEPQ